MCEFLILKDNYTAGWSAKKIREGRKQKGVFVECYEDGICTELPSPNSHHVILKVPGMSFEDGNVYCQQWRNVIDYEVIGRNVPLDGYRIRVWSTKTSVSDQGVNSGRITRAQVENYLNKWNGAVFSEATNGVIFDIKIYDMAISEGFWDYNLSDTLFEEDSYDTNTGVHTITFHYSSMGLALQKVQKYIVSHGGTILDATGVYVQYSIPRSIVMSDFRADVKSKVEKILYRNQYYLANGAVNAIVSASGMMTATEAQLNTYIRNRLDE